MVAILHGLALVFYIIAAGVLVGSLAEGRRTVPAGGGAALVAAVVAHGAALGAYAFVYGEPPLVGLAPSLSALAFLIGIGLLIMAAVREARTIGLILVPLAAALLVAALALGIAPAGEPMAFRGPWLYLHVVLAFIGYAGLAVAFASGLIYLLQFRELKGKRLGRMFRFFPSLNTLDLVGGRALVVGFPALSVALLLGWAWTVRFHNSLAIENPEVIWGVLTWFIFAAVLTVRSGGRARSRRGAMASVVGFAVVVLAYVLLRLTTAGGDLFL